MIRFTLNGASVEVQDSESRTLLEFLRNVRCMKGTKEACGTGHCGACSVLVDGKLMPALDSIEGLGDKAADAVVLAARDGQFLSKDDFRQRTKVSKSVIDFMDDLHFPVCFINSVIG